MNRKEYNGDTRYAKVLEKMDLLEIMDVSTTRQSKNGTIVWKLPIKHPHTKQLIKVASFKTGYVRNQNCCHSNYQLNKFTGKARILIPIEIDRLEYLIAFCLKNYYITYANHVANGDFVNKREHEWELKQEHTRVTENNYLEPLKELSVNVNGQRYKVI